MLLVLINILNELGIKSVMLIPIITEIEKERHKTINLLIKFVFIFKNIIIEPNIVDNPAIDVIINGYKNEFIMSPIKYMLIIGSN